MHPAPKTMLTETVLHASYTGQDAYGKPQHGPAVARLASIEYRLTTGNPSQGAERVSFTIVYMDADFPLSSRDKMTLPDGTSPAIQEVGSKVDPEQPGVLDYYRVVL